MTNPELELKRLLPPDPDITVIERSQFPAFRAEVAPNSRSFTFENFRAYIQGIDVGVRDDFATYPQSVLEYYDELAKCEPIGRR